VVPAETRRLGDVDVWSDLTQQTFRETMESLDEVKIWIWAYKAA
jgi:hypothetical protein